MVWGSLWNSCMVGLAVPGSPVGLLCTGTSLSTPPSRSRAVPRQCLHFTDEQIEVQVHVTTQHWDLTHHALLPTTEQSLL